MSKVHTAFYISSKNITALKGKTLRRHNRTDIVEAAMLPVPTGTVINGIIMDEEGLFDTLAQVCQGIKSCSNAVLVLDTTHIIYRLSVLPKVSGKEMQKLVKNEFINKDMNDKEYIYDYAIIKSGLLSKKQQLVLSCAIDKTIVDTYKALFKRAGIKLARIDYSVNTVLQAISEAGDIFGKANTLICIVDHYIVSIVNILANGNIFFHRSRIISTENDGNYFSEIYDVIYSYIQGRKSIERNEKTEKIYIFDSNIYQPEEYENRLSTLEVTDIVIGIKNIFSVTGLIASEADKYLYNLFVCISSVKKPLNLLIYRKPIKFPKRKLGIGLAVTGSVAVVSLSAAYLYNSYTEVNAMRQELETINMYLNSDSVKASVARYHELTDESVEMSIELAPLIAYQELVSGTAVVKRDVVLSAIDVFKSQAVIKAIVFDSESKSVVFDCEMENPLDISYFVWRLRVSNIFSYVSYMGYDDGQARNANWYGFRITCLLREVKAFD